MRLLRAVGRQSKHVARSFGAPLQLYLRYRFRGRNLDSPTVVRPIANAPLQAGFDQRLAGLRTVPSPCHRVRMSMRVRLDGLNRLLDKRNLVQRTNPSTILISLNSAFSSGALPSVSCQRLSPPKCAIRYGSFCTPTISRSYVMSISRLVPSRK